MPRSTASASRRSPARPAARMCGSTAIARCAGGAATGRGRALWSPAARPRPPTRRPYTALLGAVYLAELTPMIRVANVGVFGGWAELNLLDIDATGSLHGQA